MKLYFTDSRYYGTKGEAMKAAREAARQAYDYTPVDLVMVATDKANILRLANVEGGHTITLKEIARIPGKLI